MEPEVWAQNLKIFDVSVHQTIPATEEALNNHVNKKTQQVTSASLSGHHCADLMRA